MFFDDFLYSTCTFYLLQNNAVIPKGQTLFKAYLRRSLQSNTFSVRFVHTISDTQDTVKKDNNSALMFSQNITDVDDYISYDDKHIYAA
jgi:hypothetical protein